MYGWRGRVGLIVPSTNGVAEMEAFRMLPEGVSVHFTRIPYAGTGTEEAESKMLQALEDSARLLAGSSETVGANVVGLAHGSGTSYRGAGFDRALNERMSKIAGVPAISMSTAVVDALNKLGAKRVSVASPFYQTRMLEKFKSFLEGYGFEVKEARNLQLNRHDLVSREPPQTAYHLMKSVNKSDSDAIVLNNPNIRTLEIIEPLENDLGKPVVAGNQALMWACLRTIGVKDPQTGLGRLFRTP